MNYRDQSSPANEHPRRRLAQGPARCRRARRVIATLTSLDSALLFLSALTILQHALKMKDVALYLVHVPHLFTAMFGWTIVYHTAYSYDIMQWLVLAALIALVGDLLVVLFRIIIIFQTKVDDDVRFRTQMAYIVIALAFIVVDFGLMYYGDELRSCVVAPLAEQQPQQQQQQQQQNNLTRTASTSGRSSPTANRMV
jgi:hypothetical protein